MLKKNIKILFISEIIVMVVVIAFLVQNKYQKYSYRSSAQVASPNLLHWSPPLLSSPTVLSLGTSFTNLTLDPVKDYVIVLPRSKVTGNISLNGGHNILIRGGYVSVPTTAAANQQHAFRLSGQTGTVHIEGVLIDASNGGEEDCFYLDTPQAIIQIENVRCMNIPGTQSTNHSDIVQFHAGHKEVRIDRLTGSSYFQGLFIGEHDGPGKFGPIYVQNVNLRSLGDHHHTLLWMAAPDHNYLMGYTISLKNVWLAMSTFAAPGYDGITGLVSPNDKGVSPWTMVLTNGNHLTWPGIPNKVSGYAIVGSPPTDFVPDGSVGIGYMTPGYESDQISVMPSQNPSPTWYCGGSSSCIPSGTLTPTVSEPTPTTYIAPSESVTSPIPTDMVPTDIVTPESTIKPTVELSQTPLPGGTVPGGSTFIAFLLQFILMILSFFSKLFH